MIFIDNKYTKLYYMIVEQAKSRTISGYTETHHIIPKSLGGKDSKDNLVVLTAKEHYICHRLLTKMTKGRNRSKMWNALNLMINAHRDYQKRYVPNGRVYQTVKEELSKIRSKQFSGKNNPMYGKEFTEEHRAKLREAAKHKVRTKEHNRNISLSQLGRVQTEETKRLMKEAHKHREKLTCEHCGKDNLLKHLYIRWHGSNCKHYA
jgi:5-methylcytosine-specific restriction endonuclease McrA